MGSSCGYKRNIWRINILARVPKGSILGLILFKIFMNDILFVLDTTHWVNPFLEEHYKNVFISLAVDKILILFCNNKMKLNTVKCYLLLHTQEQNVLKTGYFNLKNSYYEKLLGVNFDW